jgi:hypothetical protein
MRKYQKSKVTRCYDLASAEYSKKFSRELDGKPLDCSLLERFAEVLPADATWNLFDPDRVIALVSKQGFAIDEALILAN